MSRRATMPLNSAAVRAADDQFYANHPELVQNGQRIPLDPNDPSQAALREEWMNLYAANGGQVEGDEDNSTPDDPVQECPGPTANLIVTVLNASDSQPIQGATVEISGPSANSGMTDASGIVEFENITPGLYTIHGEHAGYGEATDSVDAPDSMTSLATLQLQQYAVRDIRWVDTQAYCGDEAQLEAVVIGYPPNSAATIEVLHPSNGSVVSTIHTSLTGGRIDTTWIAKAQSANWRTDAIRFRLSIPSIGITATSTNTLTFRQRPTTNWILIHRDLPAPNNGYAPPSEHHDARLEAGRVHYSLKLRTHGDPFGAVKQNSAKTLIEQVWNNGFTGKKFHRASCQRGHACDCSYDCCKVDFRFDVNFVTSGEHVAVEIKATIPPAAPEHSSMNGDGGEWADPPIGPTTTYPHETGHVLGQYDEYSTGATDTSGTQPTNATGAQANLMSTAGNQRMFNRHFRWVLKFLNDNANGDPYEITPP